MSILRQPHSGAHFASDPEFRHSRFDWSQVGLGLGARQRRLLDGHGLYERVDVQSGSPSSSGVVPWTGSVSGSGVGSGSLSCSGSVAVMSDLGTLCQDRVPSTTQDTRHEKRE